MLSTSEVDNAYFPFFSPLPCKITIFVAPRGPRWLQENSKTAPDGSSTSPSGPLRGFNINLSEHGNGKRAQDEE